MTEPQAMPSMPGAKRAWTPLALAILAAAWIASVGNWPLWLTLVRLPEMASFRGALFIAGFAVMVGALTAALLAVFAWRWTIKPAIGFFLLSAAVAAHFMGTYGVVLDPSMMTNVVQTDPREVRDLLTLPLVANLLVIALLPLAWLVRVPLRTPRFRAQATRNGLAILGCIGLLAALIFVLFADLSATMRNHRSLRYLINPVNAFFSLGVLATEATARPTLPLLPIGADARIVPRSASARPPLLILVIGETARADHFALNGYARPTNPELGKSDVVSFRDVTSCGTSTAASLPCMFSALGRKGYEARERDQENLLDVVQRAGLAVLWVDNQSGCKGLCDRVAHQQASAVPPGGAPLPAGLCSDGECYDDALLHNLDARLATLPAERRERGILIVLHQMGSHGPAYYRRSPPGRKPFVPECETTVLQQCDRQAVINAYDNSIVYTDHMLAGTLRWLERHEATYATALLYVSDHGESLGENNLYLHGLPYAWAPREQVHVPMLAWLAPPAPGTPSAALACLRQRRDEPLSHDHLFHTTLGQLGIQTQLYRKAQDAFAPCRVD